MDQTNIEGQSLNTATSFQCRNDLLSKSMNFTRTRNLDTHFLIWLDTSLYAQEMYIKLRSIIDHVLLLDNIDLCIKQLTDNKEQVFLIVSSQYVEKFIPNIHNISQLNSIFIFDQQKTKLELQVTQYSK
ncbi:unnamed protein product, partial [Rotaria sp. Silwood2]